MQQDGTDQHATLEWKDGVPIASRFDDPYFSLGDGLAETRYVFLQGNDLPARLRDGFHIAELGVGTGLNLLAAVALWHQIGGAGTLRYTGFEAYPMARDDMARALAPFAAQLPGTLVRAWLQGWTGAGGTIPLPGAEARIVIGDAAATLPSWNGAADAWFLDGFAPAKNPDLWAPDLLQQVARHTAPGGSFATYTAAGAVRRALAQAGFDVARVAGYGRKRHMTKGRLITP